MSGKSGRRVAFAATRRVGNSVERHRHIRKLREFYRWNKDLFRDDGHYFLLVRAAVEDWGMLGGKLKDLLERTRTGETTPRRRRD